MQQFHSRPFLIFYLIVAVLIAVFMFGNNQKVQMAQAQTEPVRFAVIGDYGDAGLAQVYVSEMVKSWNPDFMITVGDNNYPDGDASTIDDNVGQYYSDFIYPYRGDYGPGGTVNRFFPTLGNHDWETPDAQPFLDYFTLPGNERYYNFREGPVEFFAIDSDSHEPDGISVDSTQAQWLKSALEASTAPWRIVYFHHPPYSSATTDEEGGYEVLDWPFEEWGATLVLSGHAHSYERIIRNDFPYIVNGIGGKSPRGFNEPIPGSVIRYNATNGAMLVEVTDELMNLEFYSTEGRPLDYDEHVIEGEWVAFDVTSAVQADDTYSFAISSGHASSILFSSKENVRNQPELVIEVADDSESVQTLTYHAVDDTYIKSSSASGNYGAEATIRTRLDEDDYNSYLKFQVSDLNGTVRSAHLRLFVDRGPETGAAVYAVSNNLRDSTLVWTEETLTWNNAPPMHGPDMPLDTMVLYADSSPALPVISILNPDEGTMISDTVLIETMATDRTDLPQELNVEVRFDGGEWLPTTFNAITAHHEFVWDTSLLDSLTRYTIEARVTDSDSNTAMATPVTVTTIATPKLYTFTVSDDAYVDATEPDVTLGRRSLLYLDGDPLLRGYLRFEVENVVGNIQSATLRIYSLSDSNNGYEISSVADDDWNERTITFSNAPSLGSTVAASGPLINETWAEFDVTSLITGDGPVSFALTTTRNTRLVVSSREGGFPAELQIEVLPTEVSRGDSDPADGSEPPHVNIEVPADGSAVTSKVPVHVSASDDWDVSGNLLVEVSYDDLADWQNAAWNTATGTYEAIWNSLDATTGAHTIRARATDSHGQMMEATAVTVIVDDQNNAPKANNVRYRVDAGELLDVPAPGVLRNDEDLDGDTLTAWLNTPPTYGTVDLNMDGSFTYSPGTAVSGTDRFTYTVSDGRLISPTASVVITIDPIDTLPVVTIVSPENDSALAGPVTMQVEASNNENSSAALRVEYRFDDSSTWNTMAWNSGSGYYEKIWNPASAAIGAHTIYARAADDTGAFILATPVTVTVGLESLHVHDLDASTRIGEIAAMRAWSTSVTVTVYADDDVTPIADAIVTGHWNNEEIVTAKTNLEGEAVFNSVIFDDIDRINRLTFTIANITHPALEYVASSNDVPNTIRGVTGHGTRINIPNPQR